jgi:hypothetical protein
MRNFRRAAVSEVTTACEKVGSFLPPRNLEPTTLADRESLSP